MVCDCLQPWSVEHFHIRRPGSGRPRSTDARQDWRIVWPVVAALTASRGKKSGHMLHLLYDQGKLGTICFQQDSDHVCLWPGYHLHHDIVKHDYRGVVKETTGEWNDALLSSVMRVGSICMRMMDVHVYGVDLLSVIFRSAILPRHTGPTSGVMVWGPSVTTRCHIWCFYRLKQGFSNSGTRTTSDTPKVVRWYAIKFIKMVQGAKRWKYTPFYLSFGFTYVGN